MKITLSALLISLIFLAGCKDVPPVAPVEEPAFDMSVVGDYLLYDKMVDFPQGFICNDPYAIEISKVNDTSITFKDPANTYTLAFKSESENTFTFSFLDIFPGSTFGRQYTLTHYPCADSIYFSSTETYSGKGTVGYGKKVNGKSCPVSAVSGFDPLRCDQGQGNAYCYSSASTRINLNFGAIDEMLYLFADSSAQTVKFGIPYKLEFTVPTDSSFAILTGEYRIGLPGPGEKPVKEIAISDNTLFSVFLEDFQTGNLSVSKSGETYTISFRFSCNEASHWTGFYQGLIK